MTKRRDPEQEGLPGIPQPAKREVIDDIEDLCLERDGLSSQRTAVSDEIAALGEQIQAKLVEHKRAVYTFKDASGILQDVFAEPKLKKVKSKLNPKNPKKDGE